MNISANRLVFSSYFCLAVAGLTLTACDMQNSQSNKDMAKNAKTQMSAQMSAQMSDSDKEPVTSKDSKDKKTISKHDKFTLSNYDEVQMTHLSLDLEVDFDRKVLDGTAIIDFKTIKPGAFRLQLDSRGLDISQIQGLGRDGKWHALGFNKHISDNKALGTMIDIAFSKGMEKIKISYSTSPDAEGLQWLSPEQTAGKKHPYLFSQAQALNARTMVPLQDTPAVRFTYDAILRVPDGLTALMSAEQKGKDRAGQWHFSMPQPIPSYLLAIAVGDIKFKPINDTIGVYAEDYILDRAAEEFSETPLMEKANEKLYGPYLWGRYDMLVLPPSFPYGGMENPRLSFLTPTLVAGDKSLTNVVAHELAHSWSGNLVTNASWRDAWLNEGFTSYVENRVMEELYGVERAVMEQVLAFGDLQRALKEAKRPELTQLKLPDDMSHPDDAFTNVTYVKGQFFLQFLEQRYGRAAFDKFLKNWFNDYKFQSVSTEDFLAYLDKNLSVKYPKKASKEEINAWIYAPGLPKSFVTPKSDVFDKITDIFDKWNSGKIKASEINTDKWSTHEWLYFINSIKEKYPASRYKELDNAFGLTGNQNAEIAFAWYMQAIKGGYEPVKADLQKFLMNVGRGKFIYRLYGALAEKSEAERNWAIDIYKKARPGYHPIAQRRIDAIFAKYSGK